MSFQADQIRAKLQGNGPGINMNELHFLIGDGFSKRSRITGMDRKLSLNGGWNPKGIAEDKPVKIDKEKIARDLKAKRERDQYTSEINSWSRTVKKAQINNLRRQGWTDADIGHFMTQITLDGKRSWNRMIARDKARLIANEKEEPAFNVEPERVEGDYQDKLRGLYKFDRKHTRQWGRKK